jgi:dTDP-glucose pyrophosphorylase
MVLMSDLDIVQVENDIKTYHIREKQQKDSQPLAVVTVEEPGRYAVEFFDGEHKIVANGADAMIATVIKMNSVPGV